MSCSMQKATVNVQPDIWKCSITVCWQRGAQGWQPVRVGVHHPRAARLPLRGWRLLPRHPLHSRVPLQAAQGHLSHPHLPLQRQLPRSHLPWYSQGQLESCSHYIKGNFIQVTIGHACMCQNFQVLLSICSLLTDCNPNDPLVGSIAQQVNASKWNWMTIKNYPFIIPVPDEQRRTRQDSKAVDKEIRNVAFVCTSLFIIHIYKYSNG